MTMNKRDQSPEQHRMSWIRSRAYLIWGPADSWDNPLAGTKYDPRLRQEQQAARHQKRLARQEEHRARREQNRVERHRVANEHLGADE
jgi:hypothetical protein